MFKRIMFLTAATATCLTLQAQEKFEQGDPSDPHQATISSYSSLKNYVDYSRYPNFKLGIGTTVNDYLQRSTLYKLVNSNFTETVAGNAMKQASCVNNAGDMNFNTVKNYVNAATAAGLNIYGHTLAWHAQQANGWLNSLIKDKPAPPLTDGDVDVKVLVASKDFRTQQNIGWHSDFTQYGYSISYDATDGLKAHCTKKVNSWEVQYIAMSDIPLDKGTTYKMKIELRGSTSGTLHTKLGDWNSGVNQNIAFNTSWREVEVTYNNTVASPFLLLQHGDFVGDLYIRSISFTKTVKGKTMNEDRRCLKIDASAKVSDAWDNQFWLVPGTFSANSSYVFTADVRADKAASATTQVHNAPGTYAGNDALGRIDFSTNWKTITVSGKLGQAGQSIAFNLNEMPDSNSYYFDNISLKINGVEKIKNGDLEGTDVSSFKQKINRGSITNCTIATQISYVYVPSTIPLTAEEKHDTLVWAMDKWIKGMMDACGGKVKAWDVVNEAISGGGNIDGYYTLQHDNGSGNDFFWQDHMGDIEYVRQAIRLARKYGPSDIKLFINDYNLESDWDGNKKLKSLIYWIGKWEADGVTKVDGIGTQMHISCYANTTTNNNKKNAIRNMFQLMANTGKLVRVSELDMGMVDANGNTVKTENMTDAYHQQMANLYEWIVKTYLEVVPPAQQWGICFWCPTDAPANSGWRGGEPVGLWNLSYYRKHAYVGVAKGLGGINMAIDEVADESDASSAVFDLQGRKVTDDLQSLPAGLYIVGGKKVMKTQH